MNWQMIGSWAFGFFTPLVIPALVVGALSLIGLWFSLASLRGFNESDAWTGGFVACGIALVGGALAARFI